MPRGIAYSVDENIPGAYALLADESGNGHAVVFCKDSVSRGDTTHMTTVATSTTLRSPVRVDRHGTALAMRGFDRPCVLSPGGASWKPLRWGGWSPKGMNTCLVAGANGIVCATVGFDPSVTFFKLEDDTLRFVGSTEPSKSKNFARAAAYVRGESDDGRTRFDVMYVYNDGDVLHEVVAAGSGSVTTESTRLAPHPELAFVWSDEGVFPLAFDGATGSLLAENRSEDDRALVIITPDSVASDEWPLTAAAKCAAVPGQVGTYVVVTQTDLLMFRGGALHVVAPFSPRIAGTVLSAAIVDMRLMFAARVGEDESEVAITDILPIFSAHGASRAQWAVSWRAGPPPPGMRRAWNR